MVLGISLLSKSLLFPPVSAPPDTSAEATTTRQAESGREVAQSANPPDPPGGEGAEPTMGSISAPVMITMLSKDDTREKPQEKKTKVLGCAVKTLCTGFVCTTLAGCPAPQVRPTPKPAPCPAGAVEAMADKLGVRVGDTVSLYYSHLGPSYVVTVHEGSTSVELGPIGRQAGGDIFLSGTLTLGEKRVYGRFTQAHNKETGETFPVCFEMRDSFEGGRGAIIRERGGSPDTAGIHSTEKVEAVRSFE
ncbi:MAG: hypothetical protein ACXU86_10655 [Archangium sp.]